MGTVPIVEGTVESGPIDPSKLTHADILDLSMRYQDAVGIIDQQRRLLNEANRVIMKLQANLRELRGETHDVRDNEANENRGSRPAHALPAQPGDTPPGEDADG